MMLVVVLYLGHVFFFHSVGIYFVAQFSFYPNQLLGEGVLKLPKRGAVSRKKKGCASIVARVRSKKASHSEKGLSVCQIREKKMRFLNYGAERSEGQ